MTSDDRTAFEITRQLPHPRDTVWRAWSQADQLQRWWGPQGCTVQIGRFEFRPGGIVHYAMRFRDAPPMWGRFSYREIGAPGQLAWLNAFATPQGGIARAPFSELCPLEILNTVQLAEQDGATTLHLRAEPFGATDAELQFFRELHPSLQQGYGGTLDQLARHLG